MSSTGQSTTVAAPSRLLPLYGGDSLAAHVATHGGPPYAAAETIIQAVREAGLAGHGGAAFPVHRKLTSVAEAGRRTGRAPVAVANGAEGEPASAKDKTLLSRAPHLVLDGLQLAARAVGAGEAHLAVERGTGLRGSVEAALAERTGHGLCAEHLPDQITLDEWGYPLVDRAPLRPSVVKRARRAAADCPVLALKLTGSS